MTYVTVNRVDDYLYRGASYDLRVQILDEELDPFPLTDCKVLLRLADSWTAQASILELEANMVNETEGRVRFRFEPEYTVDLMARSYDLSIIVRSEVLDEDWPAFQGKLGLVGSNPEVNQNA